MNILVGLIPAVGWGFQPIISHKTGGKPANQVLGTVLACFIIGCFIFVTLALSLSQYGIDYFVPIAFWCNFIKGILWCCGMICIFTAFKILGVAKTGPISTGVQLVYTTIMGIALFRENYNDKVPYQGILICVACLVLVMVGMVFVSWKPKTKSKNLQHKSINKKTILFLCFLFLMAMVGNGSFFVFSNIPLHFNSGSFQAAAHTVPGSLDGHLAIDPNGLYVKMFGNNWDKMFYSDPKKNLTSCDNIYALSCMFPLGIGMLVGGILLALGTWLYPLVNNKHKQSWSVVKKDCPFVQGSTYYSVLAGIAFGVASLALLYSTKANGSAIASLLGQFNVVILSVFGLIIFKEKKTKQEYLTLFIGIGIITIGCIIPAFIPKFYPALG